MERTFWDSRPDIVVLSMKKKIENVYVERLRKEQVKFQGIKIQQKWSYLKVIANFV